MSENKENKENEKAENTEENKSSNQIEDNSPKDEKEKGNKEEANKKEESDEEKSEKSKEESDSQEKNKSKKNSDNEDDNDKSDIKTEDNENKEEEVKNNNNNNNATKVNEDNTKKKVFETQPSEVTGTSSSVENNEQTSYVEELAWRLLKGEDVSILEPEDVNPVVDYLERYRDQCLLTHKISECERADSIIQEIHKRRISNIKDQFASERAVDLRARLNEANMQLDDLESRIKGTLDSLQSENQRNLDKLAKKHDQELSNFVSKWQSQKQLNKYARASNALRQLRAQSILLMNQKRFDEHRKTDKMATNMEKVETEQMSRKMSYEYNNNLKNLNEKQANELNVMKMAQSRRVSEVKAAGEQAVIAMKKRITNIEHELELAKDSDKYWNLYHRNEPLPSGIRSYSPSKTKSRRRREAENSQNAKTINTLRLPPLIDPRTRKGRSQSQSYSHPR